MDICDYLEDKYPQNPLYPKDSTAKQNDKDLIQKIGPVLKSFYDLLLSKATKSVEEWLQEFIEGLEPFENELKKRATVFFGGSKPGMVSIIMSFFFQYIWLKPLKLSCYRFTSNIF